MSRKFSRRTIKAVNRPKYSRENQLTQVSLGQETTNGWYQGGSVIIPPTAVQGMRKVKHITVSLARHAAGALEGSPFHWAIVFVPEGYSGNAIGPVNGPMYEPNQFVMACGTIDPTAGPIRIRSPLSRNLNSGDTISLIIASNEAGAVYRGVISYAITLQ